MSTSTGTFVFKNAFNVCIGIIFTTFQGEVRAETQQVLMRPDVGENEKPTFAIGQGVPRIYDLTARVDLV